MTYICRLVLLPLIVLLSGGVLAAQNNSGKSDQEILIQLEQDWDAAFHRNDAEFIDKILAEEFIATFADGARADRAKELANVANFNQQVDSSKLDEFIVKIYRDTAVVWFTQRMVGPVQGKPVEVVHRYMDVFVYRDGRWQCVASQSTRVSQK
jgi:hypothetical protein